MQKDLKSLPTRVFRNCTVDSFTFTWHDNAETVAPRFTAWIEGPLSIALRHWSEFIS